MSNLCHPLLPPLVGPFFHTLGQSEPFRKSTSDTSIRTSRSPLSLWSLSSCCVASTLTEVPFYFFQSHLHTSVLPLCPSPSCAPLVDIPLFSGSVKGFLSCAFSPSHLHGISAVCTHGAPATSLCCSACNTLGFSHLPTEL